MGILLKRFDKKPDPNISFFETNLAFIPLQMLQLDFKHISIIFCHESFNI